MKKRENGTFFPGGILYTVYTNTHTTHTTTGTGNKKILTWTVESVYLCVM